jgi:hypothetical protein
MTLGPAVTTSTSSSTPTVTVNFVLTPPSTYLTSGSQVVSGNATRPGMLFTLSNSVQAVSGLGRPQ